MKNSTRKGVLSLMIFTLSLSFLFGQGVVLDFSSRVKNFVDQNPREMVYLHTDREVYSDGDRMNFKAYVRDVYVPSAISSSANLHVIIVDMFGSTQQEKIFKIINNQAEGALDIPVGLPVGEYYLIAWTNGMEAGPVEKVFKKKIFINQRILPEAYIKLSVYGTRYLPGDEAKIYVEVLNMEGRPIKKKKISYIASLNGSSFEAEYVKTDKEGKASFDISIPKNDEPGVVIVETAAQINGNSIVNSIFVPTSKTPVAIDFVPEGGLFLHGFETKFGFKAYDYLGNVLDIEGEIIDQTGNKVKDISTNALGFGTFKIVADASNPVKIRITKPTGLDIDYQLPAVQENGLHFALINRTEGNLEFVVNTDILDESISLHAVAEISGNMVFEKRFNLKNSYKFTIPYELTDQHRIVKVNLLNRTGDILAYRSVFLEGQNPVYLSDASGKSTIKPDQQNISISYNNSKDGKTPAYLCSSITDKNMVPSWSPTQDIMSWFLLGPSGAFSSFPMGFLINPDIKELELIDNYMLFLMDNDLNWARIKSGRKTDTEKSKNEFRDELNNFNQTSDFEKLISQTKANLFFSRYMVESNPDFFSYLKENKAILEEIGYYPMKLDSDEKIRRQLASGKSIMSVLMTIKPYKLMGNKIIFRGNDSFRNQGGVIIVIDGVARGTDSNVLNSISPMDVEKIEASANISDIQKYSGLNSTGVIEITTKKGTTDLPKEARVISLHPTLLWSPSVTQSIDGKLELKVPDQKVKTKMQAVVQGIDRDGNLLIWRSK